MGTAGIMRAEQDVPFIHRAKHCPVQHTREILRAAGWFLALLAAAQSVLAKDVVGWIEKAKLYPGAMVVNAKLDTGAKTSSLGISSLRHFDRDGQDWVRFRIVNRHGEEVALERPVVRITKIKRHFKQVQRRPVVRLSICIRDVLKEVEVNLVDRTGFGYRLLIGRSYLANDFLVDPDKRYTAEPTCEGVAKP
jgi:hypothetical protein